MNSQQKLFRAREQAVSVGLTDLPDTFTLTYCGVERGRLEKRFELDGKYFRTGSWWITLYGLGHPSHSEFGPADMPWEELMRCVAYALALRVHLVNQKEPHLLQPHERECTVDA